MRSRRLAALLLVLLPACKGGSDAPAPGGGGDAAYRKDIERLCDVEKLAGVADRPDENPQIVTAIWLGDNLETDQARDFLATLAQHIPEDKPNLLRSEAKKVGLPGCALAATWE